MKDARESRVAPKNWLEYLSSFKETVEVTKWVYREFVDSKAKKAVRKMTWSMVVSTIFGVVQAYPISQIFNGLTKLDMKQTLIGFAGYLVCSAIAIQMGHIYGTEREKALGYNWAQLDNKVTELFFGKSMGQHMQEGSLLNTANISKGKERALNLQNNVLFQALPMLLNLVLTYIFLWILSPVAASVMTIVLAVHFAWTLILNQRVIKVCTPIDAGFRALNRFRVERWDKIERVKTSAREDDELGVMRDTFDDLLDKDRRFWLWFIKISSFREAFNTLGRFCIMIYGAWLVWHGEWQIGFLYPLFAWSTRLGENIRWLGEVERAINYNMPSIRSMMEALTIEPDIVVKPNAVELERGKPVEIAFDNVYYAYPSTSSEAGSEPVVAVKDVSFSIKPGESLALIGGSGAGKTTINRLLLRYIDPTSGCVRVDGHDLRDLDLAAFHEKISYVPQDSYIFDGTIEYNLTYGLTAEQKAAITPEQIWNIVRLLEADFGDRLPDGLQTQVGRDGLKLSGGQKQRIALCAAVLKDPDFMIIDEATSSLDSTTEKAVQEGLRLVLDKNIGALVIAHRLSTVRYLSDQFLVLKSEPSRLNGESQVEAVAGTFEKLYEISPTFRRLADDQQLEI